MLCIKSRQAEISGFSINDVDFILECLVFYSFLVYLYLNFIVYFCTIFIINYKQY